jgi:hypothetical protein
MIYSIYVLLGDLRHVDTKTEVRPLPLAALPPLIYMYSKVSMVTINVLLHKMSAECSVMNLHPTFSCGSIGSDTLRNAPQALSD